MVGGTGGKIAGGLCLQLPQRGEREEFEKCGTKFGRCKFQPLGLRCVISKGDKSQFEGYCLRPCDLEGRCPAGQVCHPKLWRCFKKCSTERDCDFGRCVRIRGIPEQQAVCFE